MKVILLGDSITQGLGSKKISFQKELTSFLEKDDSVVNMAMTGTTICYVESIIPEIITENPDYAVILYGNVDAMLKPSRTGKVFKHLPKRFRINNGAMLLPRPFYSHCFFTRVGQHAENQIRHFFRKMVIRIDGTEQWTPLTQFSEKYRNVCHILISNGIKIILCSTVYIDDRLFNGTQNEYIKYNQWIESFSQNNGFCFIDFYHLFEKKTEKDGWDMYYNKDHFHPNGKGYTIMAKEIAKELLYSKA